MIRQEQCNKVCRILDDVLENRPTERDSLIVAVRKAFDALEQADTNCSEIPNNSDTISRQEAIDIAKELTVTVEGYEMHNQAVMNYCAEIMQLPSVQPERKTGHWILNRSGLYCCDKCMEPCASYAMMKPRDKFCKMCGSRNEVME